MPTKYNPELTGNARQLRKNMTAEEKQLWYQYLRTYPVKFYRQRVMGHYIVDFYCAKARLVVELDGSQHYDEAGLAYDRARTAYLESLGMTVPYPERPDLEEFARRLRGNRRSRGARFRAAALGAEPLHRLEAKPPLRAGEVPQCAHWGGGVARGSERLR